MNDCIGKVYFVKKRYGGGNPCEEARVFTGFRCVYAITCAARINQSELFETFVGKNLFYIAALLV
jgi:hypothetical protein